MSIKTAFVSLKAYLAFVIKVQKGIAAVVVLSGKREKLWIEQKYTPGKQLPFG